MTKLLALLIPMAVFAGAYASADADPVPAKRIEIRVTEKGFEPDNVTVAAKTPVMLVFTRKTDATCTKSVVLTLDDGKKVERDLPLGKPIEIAATFAKSGKLGYACGMNMNKGTIIVQEK